MHSKIISLTLAACFFANIGCGIKLGEKNKSEKVVELQAASCLDQSMSDLKSFFSGDASGEQLSEALVCMQSTIKDFQTNIRGKNKDAYTAEEMANFISKQFLKDSNQSMEAMLSEVMKLKVVLVGGTPDLLTKTELNGIIDVISRLKPELAKLAPHMKILVSKWKPEGNGVTDEVKFTKAKEALDTFLNRLGNLIASTERSYDINDLVNLVVEAAKYSKANEESVNKIINARLLLVKFKKSLIGGNTSLKGKEWIPFTRTISEGYALILRYKYFYDDLKDNQRAEKWMIHQKAAKDISSLLNDLLTFKDNHFFSAKELSDLILTAQDLKYINGQPDSKKFSLKGLDSLFTALWNNVLVNPENRLNSKNIPGFNAEALQIVVTEAGYFIENQILIGSIFAAKTEYKKDELIAALSIRKSSVGVQELTRALSINGEMNFDSTDYLKVVTDTNGLYHVQDLEKANLSRTLARILIRSYANEIERVNNLVGIKLEEAQLAFDQLKDLVLELELVDPRTANTFIASRFREANLFISVGNGDGLASYEEIDHLLLHIFSGVARAKSLEKLALQKCVKTYAEIIAQTEFDKECLLNLYYEEDNSFANLPEFLKLKTEKNDNGELKYQPEEVKKYYDGLLKAAGYIPNDRNTVYLADAALFPHVVQYVEMLYSVFDVKSGNELKRDNILEKEEIIAAFPRFKAMLAEVINKMKPGLAEDLHLGIFIWIVKNEKMPEKKEMLKVFGVANQFSCRNLKTGEVLKPGACNNPAFPDIDRDRDWDTATTRFGIGKIFNVIAEMTKPIENASESAPKVIPAAGQ